ncbi:MAG TPA: hypothetical protein VN110_00950 [Sphingobium sp.]|nr:hypothetical protein [Sphingobium sp.]
MLYKAFAVITLVAAPLIVLMVQGLAPHMPEQTMSNPVQPVVEQAVVAPQPLAAPVLEQPTSPPTSFGQPMPEAGKPFLSPGNGLPGTPSVADGEAGNSGAEAGSDSPQP